jgi:hypothetical protein
LLLRRPHALLFASGLLSAVASIFLFAGLASRIDWRTGTLFRVHDVAAALAMLAIALSAWQLRTTETGRSTLAGTTIALVGTVSAALTALCLALVLLVGTSDMLYMLPQGGVGIWLIALCTKGPKTLGPATRILGMAVGVGLILIAGSAIAIAIAQGPEQLALIHQNLGEPDPAIEDSPMNVAGHQFLSAGTLLALPLYPVWAVLTSRAFATKPPNGELPRASGFA